MLIQTALPEAILYFVGAIFCQFIANLLPKYCGHDATTPGEKIFAGNAI
jgi:hypothetical protein